MIAGVIPNEPIYIYSETPNSGHAVNRGQNVQSQMRELLPTQ